MFSNTELHFIRKRARLRAARDIVDFQAGLLAPSDIIYTTGHRLRA